MHEDVIMLKNRQKSNGSFNKQLFHHNNHTMISSTIIIIKTLIIKIIIAINSFILVFRQRIINEKIKISNMIKINKKVTITIFNFDIKIFSQLINKILFQLINNNVSLKHFRSKQHNKSLHEMQLLHFRRQLIIITSSKKYSEKKNHHEKVIEHENHHQHHEKKLFRNVMIEIFFNNSNEFKYDLTSYICQQTSCVQSFDNVIKLRDYVFEYHDVNINFAKSKYRIRNVNYITHAKKHVYNYSSFFFMNYAMISTFLFDRKITSCLNTNENVFLCDRDFLFNRNIYDFVHDFKFIIIIEIIDIQICDEYIDTKVLLNSNKILIQMKIYLIDNFQSGFIININVLNKNDINSLLTR